jgi:hypothetical protein
MANLKVNNYHNPKLCINEDEYWDFYLYHGSYKRYGASNGSSLYDSCLISYIDLSDKDCIGDDNWIYGTSAYTWESANTIDNTLYNISYVGIDNGLFTYRKDRILNSDFINILQNNKYTIEENDNRLKLHAVSGNTLVYDYPLHLENGYTTLNGGFYQGFFKTECDKYQVLPSSFNDGDNFHIEMTLKKCDLDAESNKTLNDKYPNNKGIFFYIGTRAENKWIYMYDTYYKDGYEECSQLGIGDFVEDGDIDKNTYIINNFFEVDPSYEEEDIEWTDLYTDYKYYDEELYNAYDECEFDDMYNYLEIDYRRKPIVIDESNDFTTIGWCCSETSNKTVLKPYRTSCGCPIRYKRVSASDSARMSVYNHDAFGDEYIGSFDDISDSTDCQDYIADDVDITDFEYELDNGLKISEANQYTITTDNKFLFFDRTCTGKTIQNWIDGTEFMFYGRNNNFKGNLFILMNRTATGYNVNTIDELRNENINDYNVYSDLYDNALAFRITDSGAIGYRLLTIDCDSNDDDKTLIMEDYSFDNVVPQCEWFTVNIRIIFLSKNKMKFAFYIDGKLVYITKELPRIRLRELNDLYDKQEGVPYNISLGGGTQGLCDTVQKNYMLEPDRVYPLEENFAGSFIGYMKSFRMYNCQMEQMNISNNAKYDAKK